jgi:hypothetical protein
MPPNPLARPLRWAALLRSSSAWHAFQAYSSNKLNPVDILEYLLLNDAFPRSFAWCIEEMHTALIALCGNRPSRRHESARPSAGPPARRHRLHHHGRGAQRRPARVHRPPATPSSMTSAPRFCRPSFSTGTARRWSATPPPGRSLPRSLARAVDDNMQMQQQQQQ